MAGARMGMPFERTGAFPIDTTMTLTKAQMLTVDDAAMPEKYFTVCQDDGKLYLYDKSATPSAETGKFSVMEGGASDIFYITVDGDGFTPTSDPDVYEMELTSPYTLAELNAVLQAENPKSMVLRVVSTSGTTKSINEVLLDAMTPTGFEGDLFYTDTYMNVSHSYTKFIIANAGGKTMLTYRAGRVGGEEHVELTQAEYDALSTEEKNNGKVYFITDADGQSALPPGGTSGQVLVKQSDADDDASWQTMPDSQTVLNMLLRLAPPKPFSDASWEEISTYLDWHKQGLVNIYDYWSVGDTKVIHMGSYISSSFPEKDVEIMLVGTDSRPLSDGTRSTFIWQQRYAIDQATTPPASDTIAAYYARLNAASLQNDKTYNDCYWKNTLDVDYFNALPAEMRALCKEMKFPLDNFIDGAVYTGKVVLPSEFEIFGTRTHDREPSGRCKQFEYYATQTRSFIRRATYKSGTKEYTYENTAGWLRSRDYNPGTKWTYNNKGVVTVVNYVTAELGILPTGAF